MGETNTGAKPKEQQHHKWKMELSIEMFTKKQKKKVCVRARQVPEWMKNVFVKKRRHEAPSCAESLNHLAFCTCLHKHNCSSE